MGLTESKIKELEDKDFDKLFEGDKKTWLKMAEVAYDFAKAHIAATGSEPLDDDVAKALLITLEPNDKLRKHQEENGARYKKYREAFCDYIVFQYMKTRQAEPEPKETS